MKITVNVNLGGVLYVMDEDASALLKSYLTDISDRIADPVERKDVVADVEVRITEIFKDMGITGNMRVVNIEHVRNAISIIGSPEIFGNGRCSGKEYAKYVPYSDRRKLMRDPRDRVIGGVCSGLGLYLTIDTVFIRLIVVLLTLLGGMSILFYIIAWIIIPLPRTEDDFLILDEMRYRRSRS